VSENILDLKGRIGLVTGAGQGVGRQVALHFAQNGAGGVVVNDFRLERAEAVAKEVEGLGCRALAVQADVTDREAVEAMVKRAANELGAVDILVNNAGNMGSDPKRVSRKPFWESDTESWNVWIGVNLYGVLNCSSAAASRTWSSTRPPRRGRRASPAPSPGRSGVTRSRPIAWPSRRRARPR